MSLFANPELFDEYDEDQDYDDYEGRDPEEVSLAIEQAINDIGEIATCHRLVAEQLQTNASEKMKQVSLTLLHQTHARHARRYNISYVTRQHRLATESIEGVLVLEESDSKGIIQKIIDAIKKAFNWLIGLFKKTAENRPSGEDAKKSAETWFDTVKKAAESQKEDFKTKELVEDFYKKVFDGYVDTKNITSGNIADVVKKHTSYAEGLKAILSEITGVNDKVVQSLDKIKPSATATTSTENKVVTEDAAPQAPGSAATTASTVDKGKAVALMHQAFLDLGNTYKTDMGNLLKKSNGVPYEDKFNVFKIGKEGSVIDKEVGFVMAPVITNNGTKAVCMLCYNKTDGVPEWDGLVADLNNSEGGTGKFVLPVRLTEMMPFAEATRDFLIKIGELNDTIKSKTGDIEKNSKAFIAKIDQIGTGITETTKTGLQPIQKLSQICGKLTSTLGSSFPGVIDRSHAAFKQIIDDAVKQISGGGEEQKPAEGQAPQQGTTPPTQPAPATK